MSDNRMFILAFSLAGVVTVIAIGIVVYSFMQLSSKGDTDQVIDHLSMPTDVNKNSTLYLAYSSLQGKSYDEKFVPSAVVHYENLINMLTLASANAKRQEIKDFVTRINPELNEQLNSLEAMKKELATSETIGHEAKDVDHEDSIQEEKLNVEARLKKLTGDDFDKEFLSSMILNFEDNVNMSAPGEKNARREGLKQLTKEIVELNKQGMKQLHIWQMQWYRMNM